MVLFIAAVIGGITLGGIFALIALGLVLVFRATKVFNFAHGELMLLPAYFIGYSQAHHLSSGLSIPLALLMTAIVGILFYVLVLHRTTGHSDMFMGIIATFGLASILDGILGIFFHTAQFNIHFSVIPSGATRIFGASVSESSLAIAGFTVVLALFIVGISRFTHLGVMTRAAGQNAVLAAQCGVEVRRIYVGSWGVAAVLAAIAGMTYGTTAQVDTSMVGVALAALPAIVLGGLDSIEGAVIGGVIVGLGEGFTQIYLGGQYVNVVVYVALLIVLMLRPQGLFGTKAVVRA
jgi:branched-chain amino acid transport system permease protein